MVRLFFEEARRDFVSGVKLSTRGVEILMFADDMVLMAESAEGLEKNLGVMGEALSRWELKVNWKKTKAMRVARQKGVCEVRIGDQKLEQVDEMKYLGVVISADGRMENEVEARIGNATRMIGGLSEVVLKRIELSKNTKLKVVNTTMIPKLMYGCEAWSLSKKLQSRVQATQMRVMRRIEGVNKIDRVRNEVIRERLGQEGILDLVTRRQEKWLTRLQEMNNDRTTKKVFIGDLEGKRPRGRPPRRWLDHFK